MLERVILNDMIWYWTF